MQYYFQKYCDEDDEQMTYHEWLKVNEERPHIALPCCNKSEKEIDMKWLIVDGLRSSSWITL